MLELIYTWGSSLINASIVQVLLFKVVFPDVQNKTRIVVPPLYKYTETMKSVFALLFK